MVYSNADWKLKGFDLDRDLKAAKEKTGFAVDAVNPDLSAFKARGGKLILYHGWNDPAISPLATIAYYNSVVKSMGAAQAVSFVRLFLVPGMQHCSGQPRPEKLDSPGRRSTRLWTTRRTILRLRWSSGWRKGRLLSR